MNHSSLASRRAREVDAPQPSKAVFAALSAVAVTVPHSLGLGLLAFAPLAPSASAASLALWSAALPSALLALLVPRAGVIHAPSTVVTLLFAAVLATVTHPASSLPLNASQAMAVCGVTVALGFGIQWLMGSLRLASLARFLPVPVIQGFAAGVGLSMAMTQVMSGFGSGAWTLSPDLLRHGALALLVIALALLIQRRWSNVPGLLPAVAILSMAIALGGLGPSFQPAAPAAGFSWPLLPDWASVPWIDVVRAHGAKLLPLALLMAIVNSLDVTIFHQELELEHDAKSEANLTLRRESLVGILCALCGLIPASTSASRSRIALRVAGPSRAVSPIHAGILLVLAGVGPVWVHFVPMACLAGGLMLAGWLQVPTSLWSWQKARRATTVWVQSWVVALMFVIVGGVGALGAGLVVATLGLLRDSAGSVLRRTQLDGQMRSRRLRTQVEEACLVRHMNQVAVFDLRGVMSFGVAAYLCEQVLQTLQPRHRRVILDASKVAAWDSTALVRMAALSRTLARHGATLVIIGVGPQVVSAALAQIQIAADLDRALEQAEDEVLQRHSVSHSATGGPVPKLGELAEGLTPAGLAALENILAEASLAPGERLFAAGAQGRDLCIVQSGEITLSTAWPAHEGLRLATIGPGTAFGEMAFLAGTARSAHAGAGSAAAMVLLLDSGRFERWALSHPDDALTFMRTLARLEVARLGSTTRQLRAALE